MPYFCKECGNKSEFIEEGTGFGKCDYKELGRRNVIDSEGGWVDTFDEGEYEYEEHKEEDFESESIGCLKCNSQEVITLEEEEWDKMEEGIPYEKQKWKITIKDGMSGELLNIRNKVLLKKNGIN